MTAAATPAAPAPAAAAAAGLRHTASGRLLASQRDDSVAIFKKSWGTYQKLLAVDFLEHRAIYAALNRLLLARWGAPGGGAPPIDVLDLGCGDAQQAAAALAACGAPAGGLRLASYTGVDLSAPALALAAQHLAFLRPQCRLALEEQDMKEFIGGHPSACFDLAFASFAVHHLSLEGKAEFAAEVARCLKPGGLFVVVDIFLRDGETREQFMQRYRANMDEAVAAGIIEPEEAATAMEHITNHDWPEQLREYRALAAAAGFASCECLFTDSKEFGRLVVLRK